jgi:CRP-like cAMP-binding protein
MEGAPIEALQRVPLFAALTKRELNQIARLFKKRRFSGGETVVDEGSAGASFYLIESGEAVVSVHGEERESLKEGDHFGEIALLDEGARSATVTASGDLVCYGLTLWEFRPLVQRHGTLGWKLAQTLARMLRTERGP